MTEHPSDVAREDAWLPAPDSPWQRLDPRAIAVQPLGIIKSGGFPVIIGISAAFSQMGWFALLALPLVLVLVVLIGVATYLSTSYLVADGQIRVRRGLINRTTLTANLDKVRSVDLEAPLLHRIIGLSRVEIGTGVDDTRIELDSLGTEQARELRRFLLRKGAEAPPAESGDPNELTEPAADEHDEHELARLDPSWSTYAPLKLGGLAIVAGGFGALTQIIDVDAMEQLGWADSAWQWVLGQVLVAVAAAVVVLAVVAWVVLSVAAYLVHWWQLRLATTTDTLRLTAGLLTTRSTSIELSRIRGLRVSRAPLIRRARGADLASYATGVDEGVTSLLPTAPVEEVRRVGAELLHDTAPLSRELTQHGPAAWARIRFRGAATATVLSAILVTLGAIVMLLPADDRPDRGLAATIAAAAVIAVCVLAWAATRGTYRWLGHALTDQHLVAGHGTFSDTREVLETDGIIGWVIQQTWFQRRRGLATLIATTAAGPERVTVHDVSLGRAVALADAATPGMLAEFLSGPARP